MLWLCDLGLPVRVRLPVRGTQAGTQTGDLCGEKCGLMIDDAGVEDEYLAGCAVAPAELDDLVSHVIALHWLL